MPGILCVREGRRSQVQVVVPDKRNYEFTLGLDTPLQVACVDVAGRPVPGASVVMSRRPFSMAHRMTVMPNNGIVEGGGDAVGAAIADEKGVATVSGVMAGQYLACVSHPDFCALGKQWNGEEILRVNGEPLMVCRMAACMAVWASAQRSKVFKIKIGSVDPGISMRMDMYNAMASKAASLAADAEDASSMLHFVRVGLLVRPEESDVPSVRCQLAWQDQDGSWHEDVTHFMKIAEVRKRGPHRVVAEGLRDGSKVTFEVICPSGKRVDGVPLVVSRSVDPHGSRVGADSRDCKSGGSVYLMEGRWTVRSQMSVVGVSPLFGEFEIRGQTDVVVPLTMERELHPVRLHWREMVVLPASLGVDLSRGTEKLFSVVVNSPTLPPIWLPVGEYRLSYAAEFITRSMVFTVSDMSVDVSVEMGHD